MNTDKATRVYMALAELVDITDNLTFSFQKEEEYSQFLQKLAAEARRTGQPQTHQLCNAPVVHDATPYWERLKKLIKRSEYQEMKEWLKGKK